MPFPLLCLPLLAAIEICKAMDIKDRILFSFVSKRAKQLVKCSVVKNHLEMRVLFDCFSDFFIENCEIKFIYEPNDKKNKAQVVGGISLKIRASKGNLIKILHNQPLPETQLHIKKTLIERFADIFNKPKTDLTMRPATKNPLACLKFLKDLQLPLESVDYWAVERVSPETITAILNKCGTIQKLRICSTGLETFQYIPTSPGAFRIGELCVSGSTEWIKLEDFMACRKIHLSFIADYQTNASPAYLNSFIKKFMDTECRLESLSLSRSGRFDFEDIVHGLGEIQQQGEEQFVDVRGNNGKHIKITEKRNDWYYRLTVQVI